MLWNRISLGLAAFLLVATAGMTARGQDLNSKAWVSLGGAHISPYGMGGTEERLSFTFDGLIWHISPANRPA